MKSKIAFAIIGTAMTLIIPVSASAQSVTPRAGAATKTANVLRLSTACANAITTRLTSLTNANTRLGGLKKLSDTQKQQFSSETTSDISALQALQTQCANDFNAGNIQALRTDYKNIFSQYRIYAEFLPQLRQLIAADTMTVTMQKLSDLATKLQSRIQSAGNASNLTSLLSDMQAKIADANTQYTTIQSKIASLTPQSYNADPTGTIATLKTTHTALQTGISDIKTAFADAKQIVQILETMRKSTSPSPTM